MSASVIHPHSYLITVTSKSLLALSNELLGLVIDDIEQPEYLLSLAKTCRLLYALIVPNHLSFRHIQTHISRDEIWTLLAEKPILAAHVRILNLHGGDCRRYPRPERLPINFKEIPCSSAIRCDPCTGRTEEGISPLLSALQQMHNLSCLAITAYPTTSQNRLLQRIFNALDGAHIRLTDLSVRYYNTSPRGHKNEKVDEFPMPLNQLGYLHSLAVFTCDSTCSRHSPESLYHALMNNSATSLSSIYIRAQGNIISGLLAVYWPQLRHFSVVVLATDCLVVPETFLQLHGNLETLRIVCGSISTLVALPCLQSLCVANISLQDTNLLPNIRHLSYPSYGRLYDMPFFPDSLRELPFLESFLTPKNFSGANIALFLNKAPNIKKLSVHLPYNGSTTTRKSKEKARKVANELLVHLAKLKLTHLAGFLVGPYFEITKWHCPAIIMHVAINIPSLVYLQVNHKRRTKWAYFERDGTGKCLRRTYLDEEQEGRVSKLDPEEWGDFYHGMALR